MAKVGKLTKLKSALTRWPSLTKHHQSSSPAGKPAGSGGSGEINLRTVYVGKSRRKYQIGVEIIHHPLFQELVDRSLKFQENEDQDCVIVACEVVLFEHLLWMIKNNRGGGEDDDDEHQSGSMEELIGFYTDY